MEPKAESGGALSPQERDSHEWCRPSWVHEMVRGGLPGFSLRFIRATSTGYLGPKVGPQAIHSSNSAAIMGGPMYQPWAQSQPTSRRKFHCARVSTPSASTRMFMLRPMATMVDTRLTALGSSGNPFMKVRSIFNTWMGKRLRYASDE